MSASHSNEVEVQLRPFKHQVGGHTCVLEVTRSTICKPFIPREAWFYENEPDDLKEFTPKYLGHTFVKCNIQQDRRCLVANIPKDIISRDAHTFRKSDHVFGSGFPIPKDAQPKKKSKWDCTYRAAKSSETKCSLEAWSARCIDRQINIHGFWANNQPQKFIILENLVHDYSWPCLMDLKMGRRQFGEDSNEEKRKLLETRCACSTSATLGFRISGNQVFKVKTNNYIFHDKYFGRNLDTSGVKAELTHFFHNGVSLRTDVIRRILDKLESLRSVLVSQTDLFFHSASLLIIYDGGNPTFSTTPEYNVDTDAVSGSRISCGVGQDHNSMTLIQDEHVNTSMDPVKQADEESRNNVSKTAVAEGLHSSDKCIEGTKVDVRMIDFAHVSERRNDAAEVENIADDTIVYGVIKLQDILSGILECSSNDAT